MATPAVSRDEAKRTIAAVNDALKKGYPPPGYGAGKEGALSAAARVLRMSRGGVQARIPTIERAYGLKPNWALFKDQPAANEPLAEAQTRDTAERLRMLRKELDLTRRGKDETERTLEIILGIQRSVDTTPRWVLEPPKRGAGNRSAGTPTTIWSDWQYGEVVDKAEVAGINEFNAEIAKRRIKRLVERTSALCFDHMADPVYPGIVVMLGGDMISGGIHPELMDTDDRTPPEAVIDLFGEIHTALTAMAERFGRVFVPCVVGNHGRTVVKPRHKGRVRYSYEYILYRFLREAFESDKRVTFFIPNETDAYFKVWGHRYRLTHGESLGTRGGDGIIGVYGKIRRGAVKIRNAEAPLGRDHDTLVMGHYHQYFALPDLIVNPTLVGFSEYARSELRAVPEPPAQALWFTHPEYGVIYPNRVFVEKMRPAATTEWVSWRIDR